METKIQIKGMHCNACLALIRMELEEKGWGDRIKDIQLVAGQEKGLVYFSQLTADELHQVESTINNLDNYQVIK